MSISGIESAKRKKSLERPTLHETKTVPSSEVISLVALWDEAISGVGSSATWAGTVKLCACSGESGQRVFRSKVYALAWSVVSPIMVTAPSDSSWTRFAWTVLAGRPTTSTDLADEPNCLPIAADVRPNLVSASMVPRLRTRASLWATVSSTAAPSGNASPSIPA